MKNHSPHTHVTVLSEDETEEVCSECGERFPIKVGEIEDTHIQSRPELIASKTAPSPFFGWGV